MKVQILDKTNAPLTDFKYWGLIAAVSGALLSSGAMFPDYTPIGLYDAYQAKAECGTE